MTSKIAIFHTKYKDFHFDVSTPELMSQAALSMLYFNKKNRRYSEPINPMDSLTVQEKDLLSIREEELNALPITFKEELERVIEVLRKQSNIYNDDYDKKSRWMRKMESLLTLPFEEAAVERVAGTKGNIGDYLSINLIEERADSAYEGYEIIELDEPLDIWNS